MAVSSSLCRTLILPADTPFDSGEAEHSAEESSEEAASGPDEKSLLTREFRPGAWFCGGAFQKSIKSSFGLSCRSVT